ncbi:metallophosphoesterase family protein [Actinosynnema pretiosum]|uniref:Metallophosphoesterase n=1 Tax=Actinosynnema pretiosum TaxID=42197 RepID=A0A290Z1Y3_9PSEU|nr:metallophosphoesterase [Actinosynnema pretiosum]ATE53041.1 metallophosphoesterase [Actinosynnema pretiosum]
MRVHVVSDVHGNSEALARAGDGADALVVLGDLIDFVDYYDHSGGILGRVFGPDKVAEFARLRRGRMGPEAGAFLRTLWAGLDDAAAVVREAVHEQYTRLFGAMTAPTYATPGNVDSPELWPEFAREGVHVLDGESAEIGGLRFGFAGGAVIAPNVRRTPGAAWRAYLRTDAELTGVLAGLGEVDVLCTHVPPAVAELTYDVVARRAEQGSTAVLDAIHRLRPRWSVFGHIHQPMTRRTRIGPTECVNVGHFRRTGTPHVLAW